jgi:hypothetical protein
MTILAILTIAGCVSAPVMSRSAIIDTWEGIDDGERGVIVLNRDKSAVMQLGGEIYGEEGAKIDGKPYNLVYKIDYSKTPSWIDFIMIDQKSGIEIRRIKGIFTYLSKNQILLGLSFRAAERPLVFEESLHIDTIILSRL